MKRLWRNYSLSITLGMLFFQEQGGQPLTAGGESMENTGAAILAGLATMLAVAAIVIALIWLAYRTANRT